MDDVPLSFLLGCLVILILLSAFFSSSETGMMALNRYRLRHLVKQKNRSAMRAQALLERPDRLIGVILIGNNFVNILASAIATVIAIQLWGEAGIAIATAILTLVILIFAEVTPKTLAALSPERIAFPASWILKPLLWLLYPAVWLINGISNGLLRLFGVDTSDIPEDHLTTEELRTIVHESAGRLPRRRKGMLLGILDLEKVTVNDIMIPRQDIIGIDLSDDLAAVLQQLRSSQHTRMPVYKGDINNVVGMLHMRDALRVLSLAEPSKDALLQESTEVLFIPENTPLHTQLFNFQQDKERIGLVVDEYGDVQGLATLEDILEEIVGEFTTGLPDSDLDINPQGDGSYIVGGLTSIRDINRTLGWKMPSEGPKTLNGLILEFLEAIPEANVCLKIDTYKIEILQIKDNIIKRARLIKGKSH
ncbi:HlyC/CorC family transporter [Zooshikella marina]|uniref:HlyC/CorC family transporter n=1 Tax=Zooshikella ganghwensis TaxID=202772 RepID=UPI001BAF9DD1|nr:HlyC/CorC family transporter [Zooshikella ganghwensis]MBU2705695.1 HlyC/CorC family transporter [Zooshikella ganghwensis]